MAQMTSVVASYSELYEEGEVKHINGPTLCFPTQLLIMHISGLPKKFFGTTPVLINSEIRNNISIALMKRPKCEERVMPLHGFKDTPMGMSYGNKYY